MSDKSDWEKEKDRILAEYRKEVKKQKDAEDLKPVKPKDEKPAPPAEGSEWRRGAKTALERADELAEGKKRKK